MLREDIIKVFQICGYILLYAFAAGLLGRFAALIAEKCILAKLFKDKLKPYMDWVEISRSICILLCGTAFLIVSIGLLFLHLIGLLPPEYDEVAVQVVVAFFGLLVFVCMCLAIMTAAALLLWIKLWYRKRRSDAGINDEESGLLQSDKKPSYRSACYDQVRLVAREHPIQQHKTAPIVEVRATDAAKPLTRPQRTWIKMINLSSVRQLDFSMAREKERPDGEIYPRGRSVG